MTTESTEPVRIVATGEPMTDLLEQLDALLDETRRKRTPLNEFYRRLHVIECEVHRRLGERPPERPRFVLNPPEPPGSGGLDSPEEDAFDIWDVVRMIAENRSTSTEDDPNDDVLDYVDGEIAEYEEAFASYERISPAEFRAACSGTVSVLKVAFSGCDQLSAQQVRAAFDLQLAKCRAALLEREGVSEAEFDTLFEPRIELYRGWLEGTPTREASALLAQAAAYLVAIPSEIAVSSNFPGRGMWATAAWSIAAYETALSISGEFEAGEFWAWFHRTMAEHEGTLSGSVDDRLDR